eukprot:6179887-Pleurochrysis_carterae.AAC.3
MNTYADICCTSTQVSCNDGFNKGCGKHLGLQDSMRAENRVSVNFVQSDSQNTHELMQHRLLWICLIPHLVNMENTEMQFVRKLFWSN